MRTRKRILKEREMILLEETLAGRIDFAWCNQNVLVLSKNTF